MARAFDHADHVVDKTDDQLSRMSVATDTLLPQTINSKRARFVLPSSGILDAENTVLRLPLLNKTGHSVAFPPLGTGIWSVLDTATLSLGGQRIQSFSNITEYRQIVHMYDTPNYRQNYRRIQQGVNTVLEPTQVDSLVASGTGNPNASFAKLQPAGNQIDKADYTLVSPPADNIIGTSSLSTPDFNITLAELFSITRDVSLPLMSLRESLVIDLTFKTQSSGGDVQGFNGNGTLACSAGDLPCVIELDTANVEMYVDTLYYDSAKQQAMVDRMSGDVALPYESYITTASIVAPASNAPAGATDPPVFQTIVNQVPVAGFDVKAIMTCSTVPDRTSQGTSLTPRYHSPLLGKYSMVSPVASGDSFQVRANDELMFPQPLATPTERAVEASLLYNSPLCVGSALYSHDACTTKAGGFQTPVINNQFPDVISNANGYSFFSSNGTNGANLAQELTGNLSFSACQMSTSIGDSNTDAMLIANQKPVEVEFRRPRVFEDNYTLRQLYFAKVVMYLALKDGYLMLAQQPP